MVCLRVASLGLIDSSEAAAAGKGDRLGMAHYPFESEAQNVIRKSSLALDG
jgi:hypothetical protein